MDPLAFKIDRRASLPALDSDDQSVLTKIPQFSSGEWRNDVVGLFVYYPFWLGCLRTG